MLFSNLIGATLADAPIDTSSNGATLILLLADFEEEAEEEGRETTKGPSLQLIDFPLESPSRWRPNQ